MLHIFYISVTKLWYHTENGSSIGNDWKHFQHFHIRPRPASENLKHRKYAVINLHSLVLVIYYHFLYNEVEIRNRHFSGKDFNAMRKTTFRRATALALAFMLCTLTPVSTAQAAVIRTPSADGAVTYGNGTAVIDASHTSDGYVMIKYTGSARRIKVRITKNTQYTYDLNVSGAYETFPLTEGNGAYTVAIFEQVEGTMYAQAVNQTINVTLSNDKLPFL